MRALILHGIDSDQTGNWFPWLKAELEKIGYEVWVPDLPNADRPNVQRYTKFLLDKNWDFQDSLVIGHSSGAVEVLDLLENLPEGVKVDTAIMVAIFKGDLGWEALKDLGYLRFDYAKIRQNAKQLIVIHSDDDPHCALDDAVEIAKDLGAETKILHGMKHFSISTDPRFHKFPELLEIIKEKVPAK
jgi:predicted alpha/beta hydrolase family esterase